MPRSTLYTVQQELGAHFTTLDTWELPEHFGDPQAEYQAIRHGVGLCDVSHRGLVRMTGKDCPRFLHAMVSNDTRSLQPGQGCYSTFLTVKGHMVADFVVYAEPTGYLLELEPHAVQTLCTALDFFVISEDVTLHDESGTWGLLALQGPQATALLSAVLGQVVPELPLYATLECPWGGQTVYCTRRSYTGETGYLVRITAAELPALWQALWAQRASFGACAVGLAALETARIEAGIPRYGQDMTTDTIPVEANLEAAISYTKGCYIGQEVIARIEARGHVNRKLVGLVLDSTALPEPGTPIVSPQREVGWITSATYSPARQHTIALGYVRREVLAPGTLLTLQTKTGALEATVTALPFYTPEATAQGAS